MPPCGHAEYLIGHLLAVVDGPAGPMLTTLSNSAQVGPPQLMAGRSTAWTARGGSWRNARGPSRFETRNETTSGRTAEAPPASMLSVRPTD